MIEDSEKIIVKGAREHNLKNIDVEIPLNKLTVITGVSGSGKSSLAFDTIYAEGQRRYMETFSAYARQFIGNMERPDVESVDGLSPVISIEQKTTGWNPRSTVGTVTEVYDFLRLLYARIGVAKSYLTGQIMQKYSEEQIIELLIQKFAGMPISILAPVVRGRKGHYRELFEQIRKQGYTRVRVNGELMELKVGLKLDRYKTHNIEVVIDRLKVPEKRSSRIVSSVRTALNMGEDTVFVLFKDGEVKPFSKELVDPESGLSYEEPSPNTFSFNSPFGACPNCKGLGEVHAVDREKVIPDPSLSINQGGIKPLGELRDNMNFKEMRSLSKKHNFSMSKAISSIEESKLELILYGEDRNSASGASKSKWGKWLTEVGIFGMIEQWHKDTGSEKIRQWAESFMTIKECPKCNGARLRKESLHFFLSDLNISQLAEMDLEELGEWIDSLPDSLNERQGIIAGDLIKEIKDRVQFLLEVGLGYLTLNRRANTLSGGESQRIRLATQIGSQLTGITYILDEPSIGLHASDNERLIKSLKNLRDIGNTVIVVEHDKDLMLNSDHIIDLGPFAGKNGGQIIVCGPPDFVANSKSGLTSDYLKSSGFDLKASRKRKGNGKSLKLFGASGNNLRKVDLKIPLGTFICVTGVSGSGKSTLINETLYPLLRKEYHNAIKNPLPYERVEGLIGLDKVIEIDQSPIGRTPRSNPVTYTGVFTPIRELFAGTAEAKVRGYKPGRFSFNVKGGRCETCQGAGKKTLEMNFLPDVYVDCETCMGRRYNRETLEVIYKGKNIFEVLEMTVEEACDFFKNIPKIFAILNMIRRVGLGYITLGQSAPTLSGGEAQRVKLARELARRATGNSLYILDEPSTGLHFEDIKNLLDILHELVEKGNTVLVIEHQTDIISNADYLVDLGPGGGRNGGRIVFQGPIHQVFASKASLTAQFLT
ncbi:MAG: excinuclease ABC subunit UvrA [Saprospirales bacterium]|nr:MAG: excinuclease ABC subunit UvrA [Saprospirales bacterium]